MRTPIFSFNTNLLLQRRSFAPSKQPTKQTTTMVTKWNSSDSDMVVRLICCAYSQWNARKQKRPGSRGKARLRKRVAMYQIYMHLGAAYFKWAYRMSFVTFCKLSNLLGSTIHQIARKEGSDPSITRTGPNGQITPSVWLGCALCCYAGGSVYNIMTLMGMGRANISCSVWIVVDAINTQAKLDI
jgi:hypothetical protein